MTENVERENAALNKKDRRLTFVMTPEVHDQLRLIAFVERATLQGLLTEGMELMMAKRRERGALPKMPAQSGVDELVAA